MQKQLTYWVIRNHLYNKDNNFIIANQEECFAMFRYGIGSIVEALTFLTKEKAEKFLRDEYYEYDNKKLQIVHVRATFEEIDDD